MKLISLLLLTLWIANTVQRSIISRNALASGLLPVAALLANPDASALRLMRCCGSLIGIEVVAYPTGIQDPVGPVDTSWNAEKTSRLDELLETMNSHRQFNGTVLLAEDGKIVYEKSLGVANINDGRKLTPQSSFRLASVSKQFTAMGIMLLQEQGKLDYDDDIRKHIPELPYEGVTIRHLLHHTGGLPDYVTWFEGNWDAATPDKRRTAFNKDLVEQFAKHKPEVEFQPGERFEYSNTGYVLLACIIERVSGQPVKQFFHDRLFAPLEMNHSSAFSPGNDFVVPERVYGFAWKVGGKSHEDNDWNYLNGMVGDGGIYASARDLLKWDQALYGGKLVSQSTIDQAFTSGNTNDDQETGYGFGWGIESENGVVRRVSHGGGWVGFRTHISRDLADKRTTIVLTNHSSQHLGTILDSINKIRNGIPMEPPGQNTGEDREDAVVLPGGVLQSFVGKRKISSGFANSITASV